MLPPTVPVENDESLDSASAYGRNPQRLVGSLDRVARPGLSSISAPSRGVAPTREETASFSTVSVPSNFNEPRYNLLGGAKSLTAEQIKNLDGGDELLKLVARQERGTRGFGEAITDFNAGDLPVVGDVADTFMPISEMFKVADTVKAVDSGKQVSDQDALYAQLYLTQNERMAQQSTGGMVGGVLRAMPGFMSEIYMYTKIGARVGVTATKTPHGGVAGAAAGAVVGAGKAAVRVGARAVTGLMMREGAKEAAEKWSKKLVANVAGRSATRKFGRGMIEGAVKGTGLQLTDTALNATYNIAAGNDIFSSKQAADRYVGGKLSGDDISMGHAKLMSLGDHWIEYVSEMSGGAIGDALLPNGGTMAWLGKRIDKEYGPGTAAAVKAKAQAYTGIKLLASKMTADGDPKTMFKWLKNVGYDGYFEEMLEERYGDAARGLFGLQGDEDEGRIKNMIKQAVPDKQQFMTEAISFAVPIVTALSAAKGHRWLAGQDTPEITKHLGNALMGTKELVTPHVERLGDEISSGGGKTANGVTLGDAVDSIAFLADANEQRPTGPFSRILDTALSLAEVVTSGSFAPLIRHSNIGQVLARYGREDFASRYTEIKHTLKAMAKQSPAYKGLSEAEVDAKVTALAKDYLTEVVGVARKSLVLKESALDKAVDYVDADNKEAAKQEIVKDLQARFEGKEPTLAIIPYGSGRHYHEIIVDNDRGHPISETVSRINKAADEVLFRHGIDVRRKFVNNARELTIQSMMGPEISLDEVSALKADPNSFKASMLSGELNIDPSTAGGAARLNKVLDRHTGLHASGAYGQGIYEKYDQSGTVLTSRVGYETLPDGRVYFTPKYDNSGTDADRKARLNQSEADARMLNSQLSGVDSSTDPFDIDARLSSYQFTKDTTPPSLKFSRNVWMSNTDPKVLTSAYDYTATNDADAERYIREVLFGGKMEDGVYVVGAGNLNDENQVSVRASANLYHTWEELTEHALKLWNKAERGEVNDFEAPIENFMDEVRQLVIAKLKADDGTADLLQERAFLAMLNKSDTDAPVKLFGQLFLGYNDPMTRLVVKEVIAFSEQIESLRSDLLDNPSATTAEFAKYMGFVTKLLTKRGTLDTNQFELQVNPYLSAESKDALATQLTTVANTKATEAPAPVKTEKKAPAPVSSKPVEDLSSYTVDKNGRLIRKKPTSDTPESTDEDVWRDNLAQRQEAAATLQKKADAIKANDPDGTIPKQAAETAKADATDLFESDDQSFVSRRLRSLNLMHVSTLGLGILNGARKLRIQADAAEASGDKDTAQKLREQAAEDLKDALVTIMYDARSAAYIVQVEFKRDVGTQSPATSKPVAKEPVAKEPVAKEPSVVKKPVAEKPVVTKEPAAKEPVASKEIPIKIGVANLPPAPGTAKAEASVVEAVKQEAPVAQKITVSEYKGMPVRYVSGMTHARGGHPLGAKTKDNTIFLDPEELEKSFNNKQWSKPRVAEVIPLPADLFATFDAWVSHVLEHEYQHTQIARPKGELTDSEYAAYEMKVDDAALKAQGLPTRSELEATPPVVEAAKPEAPKPEAPAQEVIHSTVVGLPPAPESAAPKSKKVKHVLNVGRFKSTLSTEAIDSSLTPESVVKGAVGIPPEFFFPLNPDEFFSDGQVKSLSEQHAIISNFNDVIRDSMARIIDPSYDANLTPEAYVKRAENSDTEALNSDSSVKDTDAFDYSDSELGVMQNSNDRTLKVFKGVRNLAESIQLITGLDGYQSILELTHGTDTLPRLLEAASSDKALVTWMDSVAANETTAETALKSIVRYVNGLAAANDKDTGFTATHMADMVESMRVMYPLEANEGTLTITAGSLERGSIGDFELKVKNRVNVEAKLHTLANARIATFNIDPLKSGKELRRKFEALMTMPGFQTRDAGTANADRIAKLLSVDKSEFKTALFKFLHDFTGAPTAFFATAARKPEGRAVIANIVASPLSYWFTANSVNTHNIGSSNFMNSPKEETRKKAFEKAIKDTWLGVAEAKGSLVPTNVAARPNVLKIMKLADVTDGAFAPIYKDGNLKGQAGCVSRDKFVRYANDFFKAVGSPLTISTGGMSLFKGLTINAEGMTHPRYVEFGNLEAPDMRRVLQQQFEQGWLYTGVYGDKTNDRFIKMPNITVEQAAKEYRALYERPSNTLLDQSVWISPEAIDKMVEEYKVLKEKDDAKKASNADIRRMNAIKHEVKRVRFVTEFDRIVDGDMRFYAPKLKKGTKIPEFLLKTVAENGGSITSEQRSDPLVDRIAGDLLVSRTKRRGNDLTGGRDLSSIERYMAEIPGRKNGKIRVAVINSNFGLGDFTDGMGVFLESTVGTSFVKAEGVDFAGSEDSAHTFKPQISGTYAVGDARVPLLDKLNLVGIEQLAADPDRADAAKILKFMQDAEVDVIVFDSAEKVPSGPAYALGFLKDDRLAITSIDDLEKVKILNKTREITREVSGADFTLPLALHGDTEPSEARFAKQLQHLVWSSPNGVSYRKLIDQYIEKVAAGVQTSSMEFLTKLAIKQLKTGDDESVRLANALKTGQLSIVSPSIRSRVNLLQAVLKSMRFSVARARGPLVMRFDKPDSGRMTRPGLDNPYKLINANIDAPNVHYVTNLAATTEDAAKTAFAKLFLREFRTKNPRAFETKQTVRTGTVEDQISAAFEAMLSPTEQVSVANAEAVVVPYRYAFNIAREERPAKDNELSSRIVDGVRMIAPGDALVSFNEDGSLNTDSLRKNIIQAGADGTYILLGTGFISDRIPADGVTSMSVAFLNHGFASPEVNLIEQDADTVTKMGADGDGDSPNLWMIGELMDDSPEGLKNRMLSLIFDDYLTDPSIMDWSKRGIDTLLTNMITPTGEMLKYGPNAPVKAVTYSNTLDRVSYEWLVGQAGKDNVGTAAKINSTSMALSATGVHLQETTTLVTSNGTFVIEHTAEDAAGILDTADSTLWNRFRMAMHVGPQMGVSRAVDDTKAFIMGHMKMSSWRMAIELAGTLFNKAILHPAGEVDASGKPTKFSYEAEFPAAAKQSIDMTVAVAKSKYLDAVDEFMASRAGSELSPSFKRQDVHQSMVTVAARSFLSAEETAAMKKALLGLPELKPAWYEARAEFITNNTAIGAWIKLHDIGESIREFGSVADTMVVATPVKTVEAFERAAETVANIQANGGLGSIKVLHPEYLSIADTIISKLQGAMPFAHPASSVLGNSVREAVRSITNENIPAVKVDSAIGTLMSQNALKTMIDGLGEDLDTKFPVERVRTLRTEFPDFFNLVAPSGQFIDALELVPVYAGDSGVALPDALITKARASFDAMPIKLQLEVAAAALSIYDIQTSARQHSFTMLLGNPEKSQFVSEFTAAIRTEFNNLSTTDSTDRVLDLLSGRPSVARARVAQSTLGTDYKQYEKAAKSYSDAEDVAPMNRSVVDAVAKTQETVVEKTPESNITTLVKEARPPAMFAFKELAKANRAEYVLAPTTGDAKSFAVRLGAAAERADKLVSEDTTDSRVYVSLPGSGRIGAADALAAVKDSIPTLLDWNNTLITDNEDNATRAHNASGEGELRKFLQSLGAKETSFPTHSEWTKAAVQATPTNEDFKAKLDIVTPTGGEKYTASGAQLTRYSDPDWSTREPITDQYDLPRMFTSSDDNGNKVIIDKDEVGSWMLSNESTPDGIYIKTSDAINFWNKVIPAQATTTLSTNVIEPARKFGDVPSYSGFTKAPDLVSAWLDSRAEDLAKEDDPKLVASNRARLATYWDKALAPFSKAQTYEEAAAAISDLDATLYGMNPRIQESMRQWALGHLPMMSAIEELDYAVVARDTVPHLKTLDPDQVDTDSEYTPGSVTLSTYPVISRFEDVLSPYRGTGASKLTNILVDEGNAMDAALGRVNRYYERTAVEWGLTGIVNRYEEHTFSIDETGKKGSYTMVGRALMDKKNADKLTDDEKKLNALIQYMAFMGLEHTKLVAGKRVFNRAEVSKVYAILAPEYSADLETLKRSLPDALAEKVYARMQKALEGLELPTEEDDDLERADKERKIALAVKAAKVGTFQRVPIWSSHRGYSATDVSQNWKARKISYYVSLEDLETEMKASETNTTGNQLIAKLLKNHRAKTRLTIDTLVNESANELDTLQKFVNERAPWVMSTDSIYMRYKKQYSPHYFGSGFYGSSEREAALLVSAALDRADKTQVSKSLDEIKFEKDTKRDITKIFSVSSRSGKIRSLEETTEPMIKYMFLLKGIEYNGFSDAIALIKSGKLVDLGITPDMNYVDVADLIHYELMEVLQARAESMAELDDSVNGIENPVALARALREVKGAYKDREFTNRTKTRFFKTFEEAFELSGRRPLNMGAADAVFKYAGDIKTATRNRIVLNQMVQVTDIEGHALVIPEPNLETKLTDKEQVLTPEAWTIVADRMAAWFHDSVDPKATMQENVERMIQKYVVHSKSYIRVDSAYDSTPAFYAFKQDLGKDTVLDVLAGGEIAGILKHVISKPWQDPWGILNALDHLNQWMKICSLQFSLFFQMAGQEGLIAVMGHKYFSTEGGPFHTQVEWRRMIKMGHPYVLKMIADAEAIGLRFGSVANPMGLPSGMYESDIAALTDYTEKHISKKAADRVKTILSFSKKQSDFMFETYYNTIKLWTVYMYSNQLEAKAEKAGVPYDFKESMLPHVDYINSEVGGANWNKYSWMTPSWKRFWSLDQFSPDWGMSAWNAAGGGLLSAQFLKNFMTPDELTFIATRRWPQMFIYVMVMVPMMVQATAFLIGKAAGTVGDDDEWLIFNNEEGRKLHANLTPLLKAMHKVPGMPAYEGFPTGERKAYIRWGKQAYETQRWLESPWNSLMSKSSQIVRWAVEQATGTSGGSVNFPLPFKDQGFIGLFQGKDGDFMGSRLGYTLQKFAPFSILAYAQNKDAAPFQILGPVTKGMGFYTAVKAYTGLLDTWARDTTYANIYRSPHVKANLESLGQSILDAAEANGYEPAKVITAAKGAVLKDYYAGLYKAINANDSVATEKWARCIIRLNGTIQSTLGSVRNRNEMYGKPEKLTEEQRKMVREAFGQ